MMTAGAWQVRIAVTGDRGPGQLSVPVPTLPKATLAMSRALGVLLAGFMLLLCAGFVAIVATIVREAGLEPGETADRSAAPPRSSRRIDRRGGHGGGDVLRQCVVGRGSVELLALRLQAAPGDADRHRRRTPARSS